MSSFRFRLYCVLRCHVDEVVSVREPSRRMKAEESKLEESKPFRVHDCQVLDGVEGSDHAPVLVQLELL